MIKEAVREHQILILHPIVSFAYWLLRVISTLYLPPRIIIIGQFFSDTFF